VSQASLHHDEEVTDEHVWSDLTKYGSHVYVLVRRSELRASKIMAKRLTSHHKVTVLWNVSPP
jgi:thioredoxin reductase